LFCETWLVLDFFTLLFTLVLLVDDDASMAITVPFAAAAAAAIARLAFLCRIPQALQSDCIKKYLPFLVNSFYVHITALNNSWVNK
jgi:hypothetical protein